MNTSLFLIVCGLAIVSCGLPRKMVGFYLLIADDTVQNYTSSAVWTPMLFDYQQTGGNVFWLAFVNPSDMPNVPPAMASLAKTKGSGKPGSIPSQAKVIFSIGGEAYSNKPNPWPFLASQQAAEAMAAEVATWSEKYGCDGIDIDIETGAGSAPGAGANMVAFMRALKQKNPNFIITLPQYGYPQVPAEIEGVNESWDENRNSKGLGDAIGLMVYSGTNSLNYVKDYANGTSQWQGFPIKVNVPTSAITVGIGGGDTSAIMTMASAINSKQLGGMMVWFASVQDSRNPGKPAYQYGTTNDASEAKSGDWQKALSMM